MARSNTSGCRRPPGHPPPAVAACTAGVGWSAAAAIERWADASLDRGGDRLCLQVHPQLHIPAGIGPSAAALAGPQEREQTSRQQPATRGPARRRLAFTQPARCLMNDPYRSGLNWSASGAPGRKVPGQGVASAAGPTVAASSRSARHRSENHRALLPEKATNLTTAGGRSLAGAVTSGRRRRTESTQLLALRPPTTPAADLRARSLGH